MTRLNYKGGGGRCGGRGEGMVKNLGKRGNYEQHDIAHAISHLKRCMHTRGINSNCNTVMAI